MTETVDKSLKRLGVTLSKPALAVVFIVFSVLLFIFPQLAGYIIALFLLIDGILILVDFYASNSPKLYVVPPPPPKTTASPSAAAPAPESAEEA